MADWTILNGKVKIEDDNDHHDRENYNNNNNNCRGILTRQKSRESPRKDDPSLVVVRKSLGSIRQQQSDDLIGILTSEESLVIPNNKLGYENDLAIFINDAGIEKTICSQSNKINNNNDEDDDDYEYNNDDDDDAESSRILDYRPIVVFGTDNNCENESGSKIRMEAKRELLLIEKFKNNPTASLNVDEKLTKNCIKTNNDVDFDRNDNKLQQQHVQFNNKSSNDDKKSSIKINEKSKKSPSISTTVSSRSSNSEDDNSSDSFDHHRLTEARAPDGGWGWVVVAAAFMVNLIADGITFSFGVIYHEFLKYFGEGKATTSWIGSLFMAMPLLSGPIASFLTDRYGCRRVTIAGSILATLGFVISYFATSLEMLVLTFGVLAGFGLSLCFVAAVVIVAYYFEKRRSFATGLSVCGSGIGTFIFPPLIQRLLEEYGWRGTTLILSGLFLNLAVCGALMRDLEWTKPKIKAQLKRQQLQQQHNKQRNKMIQSSSVDSFSASSSANTAQIITLQQNNNDSLSKNNGIIVPIEGSRLHDDDEDDQKLQQDPEKLFSSLVSLPTFVKNGEKVPLEVLELLSAKKNVYNVLLQNYPSLLISSRSFSDSSGLHESISPPSARFVPIISSLVNEEKNNQNCKQQQQIVTDSQKKDENNFDRRSNWWITQQKTHSKLRRSSASEQPSRRFTTAYLKDIRMHRHSLTYRGAMLNINRYRLRASSCPDILRNSMTTIAQEETGFSSALRELKDLIVNIFDLTHFREPMFTLFAMSNFLLHTWYDVPYMYLTDNAIEVGFSESEASYLISIIGIMNMTGEISLGWAGDRSCVNASVVYAICMVLTGAFAALIPFVVKSYYLLSSIAGAFGFFIAANYSLTSIILVKAITIERFTNAYGLLLFVQGIANLMGPPIAGWLYDVTGSYDLSFYLAGGFIAFSGIMFLVMPMMSFYRKLKEKAHQRRNRAETDFTNVNSV